MTRNGSAGQTSSRAKRYAPARTLSVSEGFPYDHYQSVEGDYEYSLYPECYGMDVRRDAWRKGSAASPRYQSWAGCIINTSGFRF
jgi:hypothetical protein